MGKTGERFADFRKEVEEAIDSGDEEKLRELRVKCDELTKEVELEKIKIEKNTVPLGRAFVKVLASVSDSEQLGDGNISVSIGSMAKAFSLSKIFDIGLTAEEKEAWENFLREVAWDYSVEDIEELRNEFYSKSE